MPQGRKTRQLVKTDRIRQVPKRNRFRINKVFFDALNCQCGFIVHIIDFLHRLSGFKNPHVFQFKFIAFQFRRISLHSFKQLRLAVHFQHAHFSKQQHVFFLTHRFGFQHQKGVFVHRFADPQPLVGKQNRLRILRLKTIIQRLINFVQIRRNRIKHRNIDNTDHKHGRQHRRQKFPDRNPGGTDNNKFVAAADFPKRNHRRNHHNKRKHHFKGARQLGKGHFQNKNQIHVRPVGSTA